MMRVQLGSGHVGLCWHRSWHRVLPALGCAHQDPAFCPTWICFAPTEAFISIPPYPIARSYSIFPEQLMSIKCLSDTTTMCKISVIRI